jgi:hypothetical protein
MGKAGVEQPPCVGREIGRGKGWHKDLAAVGMRMVDEPAGRSVHQDCGAWLHGGRPASVAAAGCPAGGNHANDNQRTKHDGRPKPLPPPHHPHPHRPQRKRRGLSHRCHRSSSLVSKLSWLLQLSLRPSSRVGALGRVNSLADPTLCAMLRPAGTKLGAPGRYTLRVAAVSKRACAQLSLCRHLPWSR